MSAFFQFIFDCFFFPQIRNYGLPVSFVYKYDEIKSPVCFSHSSSEGRQAFTSLSTDNRGLIFTGQEIVTIINPIYTHM